MIFPKATGTATALCTREKSVPIAPASCRKSSRDLLLRDVCIRILIIIDNR
jgi:hypothetical protein